MKEVERNEKLRGFAFLSAKPQLILLNTGENKSFKEGVKYCRNLQNV